MGADFIGACVGKGWVESKESKTRTFVETLFVPGAFIYTISKTILSSWDDLHCTDRKSKIWRHYLSVVSCNSHKDSKNSYDHSIFQMRKLSLRKMNWLTQGHSSNKWQARTWAAPHLTPNQHWCLGHKWSGNVDFTYESFHIPLIWNMITLGLS